MFKKYAFAAAIATVASTVAIGAQTTPAPQSGSQAQSVFTGCVYNEKDVPGRAPNVAERAGIAEDYILAEVKPASSADAVRPTGTSGTASPAAMYKLEFVDDAKLKALVGKRVEVTGRVDAEAGDSKPAATTPPTSTTDKAIGRDRVNLAEFEVTSIKEVTGTCPATPGVR